MLETRKGIGKRDGVHNGKFKRDDSERVLDKEFMEYLTEDPDALAYFKSPSRITSKLFFEMDSKC